MSFTSKRIEYTDIHMAALRYTVKTLNIGTPRPATVVVLNMKQFNFYNEVMPPKDVDRMANSVDPDQTAP